MWQGVKWVCALVAMFCNSAPDTAAAPDLAAIQTAYEREAGAGSSLHDQGLQVLQATCHSDSAEKAVKSDKTTKTDKTAKADKADKTDTSDKFLCEITFISKGDPERPYFDVIDVARAGDGWELKGGLCKR